MNRRPRQKQSHGRSLVGQTFDVEVGPVAHGGHFVARHDGRVVFVRHALPGERVTVRVTEGDEGSRFLRGDAVSVLEPSPDRVEAPCPVAGPGLCGGCDFQHVALPAQRVLKAAVVREQLQRLAKLDVPVDVEAVPGDDDGLRWRTRVQVALTPDGRRGFRAHRSHRVVPVDDCVITRTDARVEVEGEPVDEGVVSEAVSTSYGDHTFDVAAGGFWQVHPGAPRVLVETVLDQLRPEPGESCLDLYAGVGLFSAFLADAVGPTGSVHAVEGDRTACEHARANLAAYPHAAVTRGSVDRTLDRLDLEPVDLVVLDPPREGARKPVVSAVVARAPRAVVYVACDPAALARDVSLFTEGGYRLDALRAFDLFPMTHHVECVALLTR
ncbi:class I SAM-dependent RNA methyltransferase [Nocardioides iriomotensis]|uniref:Class I SAM-dependent RNA methyltransferase n=1 Tax=Nocardioides iriomotensis TaxID=715784 RepID=A0A4Q5J0D0_9ACTN|nr:TRAM domain-containing protein [Nocardioides iriomotensis]RYU11977.1 class I SAM-dependent RNA methyltransferase [Nocardioides iriomotensis]